MRRPTDGAGPPLLLPPESGEATPRRRSPAQEEKEFVGFFMYVLTAPLVVHPEWAEHFKDRWDQVVMERLLHARELYPEGLCTEYEAMLYVSSVTLAHPVSHSWAETYMWLFQRWSPEAAKTIEVEARPLDLQQQEDLARLRRWVFRQQQDRLKGRLKEEKPSPDTEAKAEERASQPQLL